MRHLPGICATCLGLALDGWAAAAGNRRVADRRCREDKRDLNYDLPVLAVTINTSATTAQARQQDVQRTVHHAAVRHLAARHACWQRLLRYV